MGRPPQGDEPLGAPHQVRFTEMQDLWIERLRQHYSRRAGGVHIAASAVIRKALEIGLEQMSGELAEEGTRV